MISVEFERGGRIAKMNMEFSKMLEALGTVEIDEIPTETSTPAEIPTVNSTYNVGTSISQNYASHYANVISRTREIKEAKELPRKTMGIPLGGIDNAKIVNAEIRSQIDTELESLYRSKKADRRSKTVYNMASVCEKNQDIVTLSYGSIPVERSLTVKKSFKETLMSDVDFSRQWNAVKKFCSIQIKI